MIFVFIFFWSQSTMTKSNLHSFKQLIFILLLKISLTVSQSSNDGNYSTTINSNETLSTSPTVIINNSSTTSSNLIGLGWTLFIILIGSSFLIIVLALVYIVRRGTPYRRFSIRSSQARKTSSLFPSDFFEIGASLKTIKTKLFSILIKSKLFLDLGQMKIFSLESVNSIFISVFKKKKRKVFFCIMEPENSNHSISLVSRVLLSLYRSKCYRVAFHVHEFHIGIAM